MKIRTVFWTGTAVAASLVAAVPGATAPRDEVLQFNLKPWVGQTYFLTQGNPVVQDTFIVDPTPEMRLVFGSASKTLAITVIAPDGTGYTSGSPDMAGFRARTFPDPNDPNTTGANYLFVFRDPQPGEWSLDIRDRIALAATRAVLFNLMSSSSIRSGILGGGQDYVVDRPIQMATVTVDAAGIVKNVTIEAKITKPGDPQFILPAVNFRDDGQGGDQVAGDGMSTASFPITQPGDFNISAQIGGLTQGGTPFQRSASASFRVLGVSARFAGTFNDLGLDLDRDGLLDAVALGFDINTVQPGRYRLAATLEGTNRAATSAHVLIDLPHGPTNAGVSFPSRQIKLAIGVNGPYSVREARLELLDLNPIRHSGYCRRPWPYCGLRAP